MITVANRIYVKREYGEAFEARFRERAGLVDKMRGFVSNQVLRPVNEGDPYVVFTTWQSLSQLGTLGRIRQRSCTVRYFAEGGLFGS